MSKHAERRTYMNTTQKNAMGIAARTHQNCIDKTGVARPGKTASDRANKLNKQ